MPELPMKAFAWLLKFAVHHSLMLYWRKDSFEKLATLQERLAQHPELTEYCEYLRLLDSGLRKDALSRLSPLLQTLAVSNTDRRRAIACLLLRATEHETGHRLMPQPLLVGFIEPTLSEWRLTCPKDPEPLRWSQSIDDLALALSLEPECDYTRRKLVLRILGHVGCAAHELPAGYLGDAQSDLDLLQMARKEASLLRDAESRAKYLEMIDQDESDLTEHLKTRITPNAVRCDTGD
jgi:hypothetical protein